MKKYFIFLLLGIVLFSGSVSAFEFDNVKSYDETTRTVSITNAFGLGEKYTDIQLTTPLRNKVAPGYQKVAELKINGYAEYKEVLNGIEFYDINSNMKEIDRNFDLKVLSYENVLVEDYADVEDKVDIFSKDFNGTKTTTYKKVGEHYEKREVWTDINNIDLKKDQKMVVGIFTDAKVGDYVEWIPTIAGKEVKEWASWTVSLDVDINNYYKFDTVGATVRDWVNGVVNLTTSNSPGTTTGIINNAITFDGSNQDASGSNSLITKSNDYSISFWFQSDDVNQEECIFGIYIDGTDRMTIGTKSGSLVFQTYEGSSYSAQSTNDISSDTWYHAVVNNYGSNTTKELWINGVKQTGSGESLPNAGSHAGVLYFGQRENNVAFFDGYMDEVGIWSRTLTDAEAVQLYNSGSGIGFEDYLTDTAPVVTTHYPANNSNFTTSTVTINATVYDDQNLTDVDFYVDTAFNQTNTSGINNSVYTFNVDLSDGTHTLQIRGTDNNSATTEGDLIYVNVDTGAPTQTINTPDADGITTSLPYNISLNATVSDANLGSCWYSNDSYVTLYACVNDTFGFVTCDYISYFTNYISQSATYQTPVVEQTSTGVFMNITATEITSLNGTLYWNGTAYATTSADDGTTGSLSTTITTPEIDTNDDVIFYWAYNLNGVDYNTTNYTQTVATITPINITSASCVDKALKFEIQDEANHTNLNGDIEYNFKYGIDDGLTKEIYGSLSNTSTFYVCINASLSENYTIGYGEIQYRTGSHVDRRFYLFENQTISNNTLTNHTLKDLLTSDQTSFLLTMEDTNLNVYSEIYTALWRWYPDLNEYLIVEMGKTDEDGQTVAHVDTEDVDYRIGLYEKDGTLIKLDNPRRFVCTSAPCSLTIRVGAGEVDYSSIYDVETSLTYNDTTGMFYLIYNDPNQLTSAMNLLVTRETGSDTLIICNNTATGFTGAMSCNTSAYTGVKKAVVYRSASPPVVIAQKIVSSTRDTFNSGFGLFISVFLWLGIVLSGFGNNPVFTLILAVVGLIPAVLIGSINIAIFTGIAVLGAIVIHFIKRTVAR